MDWKATAQLFKTSHRLIRKRILIGAALFLVVSPTLLMHLFFWRIEKGLDLKIYRKPFFTFIPGSIHIRNVSLVWRDRLTVNSGSVAIHYPVLAILKREFPISLKGESLAIRFGPEFERVIGSKRVVFDHVDAKLIIGSKHSRRKVEIDSLDAESKTIQFHLAGKSQNDRFSTAPAI